MSTIAHAVTTATVDELELKIVAAPSFSRLDSLTIFLVASDVERYYHVTTVQLQALKQISTGYMVEYKVFVFSSLRIMVMIR